jgi:hypothetical protein
VSGFLAPSLMKCMNEAENLNRPQKFSGQCRAGERSAQEMALTPFLAYTGAPDHGGRVTRHGPKGSGSVRCPHPVPWLRTLSPAAKDRGATQAKVQADIVVSMANALARRADDVAGADDDPHRAVRPIAEFYDVSRKAGKQKLWVTDFKQ